MNFFKEVEFNLNEGKNNPNILNTPLFQNFNSLLFQITDFKYNPKFCITKSRCLLCMYQMKFSMFFIILFRLKILQELTFFII
jgi:hypothetical protein